MGNVSVLTIFQIYTVKKNKIVRGMNYNVYKKYDMNSNSTMMNRMPTTQTCIYVYVRMMTKIQATALIQKTNENIGLIDLNLL